MTYKPKSIDTSRIELPKDIEELTEILAENTHDLWAEKRIAEGWKYGTRRDDIRKQHPGLVPYEELPEPEKNYDRQTSLEAIKALLARGYGIERPTRSALHVDATPLPRDKTRAGTESVAASLASADKQTILALWADRNLGFDRHSPQTYRAVAERLLRVGEPLVAYDAASEGLRVFEQDVRLRQLRALALARSGAVEIANAEFKRLYDEGFHDEETLGMLASTHKTIALASAGPEIERRHLADAYAYYYEAYKLTGKYYSGINAATMATLLGDKSRAEELARDIQKICQQEMEESKINSSDLYWLAATQGEAALILGNWDLAQKCYEKAMQIAGRNWGDRQTSLRQARLLVNALGGSAKLIESWLRIPNVVVFVGHMIDRPGRLSPRFPPQLESATFAAIRNRLKKLDAGFGYASAACGSDILFHEAILERGGEIHVSLPFNREDFVADSVDIVPGADWPTRFDRLLMRDPGVRVVTPERLYGGSIVYDYGNRILQGLAAERADQLGARLICLAVWDRKSGDGPFGTASTVQRWRKSGNRVEIIDITKLLRSHCPELSSAATGVARPADRAKCTPEFSPRIVALLFADAKGFSKLSEQQVPLFVRHFWGLVREILASSSQTPLNCNTWGDALYFVFSKVRDAGKFALELLDRVSKIDWPSKGLPADLTLRIGIHAAPAYACIDPITARRTFVGTQVSRAARIEPITPPGAIYVSQPFALLAKSEQVNEFHCDYVGQTPMAKGYGTFPTYVLRPNKVRNADCSRRPRA
ncbi:MAG: RyR domain-containing protein [Candidatus Acidiferrales bacterium]